MKVIIGQTDTKNQLTLYQGDTTNITIEVMKSIDIPAMEADLASYTTMEFHAQNEVVSVPIEPIMTFSLPYNMTRFETGRFEKVYTVLFIGPATVEGGDPVRHTVVNAKLNIVNTAAVHDAAPVSPTAYTIPAEVVDRMITEGTTITPRGEWATATNYAALDLVTHDGAVWICITGHLSGVWEDDVAMWYSLFTPEAAPTVDYSRLPVGPNHMFDSLEWRTTVASGVENSAIDYETAFTGNWSVNHGGVMNGSTVEIVTHDLADINGDLVPMQGTLTYFNTLKLSLQSTGGHTGYLSFPFNDYRVAKGVSLGFQLQFHCFSRVDVAAGITVELIDAISGQVIDITGHPLNAWTRTAITGTIGARPRLRITGAGSATVWLALPYHGTGYHGDTPIYIP